MTINPPSYTDVLIIGAGPGGLFLAQALSRLGVRVKIVDRRGPNEKYGNADGLMSRTLEIWQSYGLFDRIAPRACPIHVMVGYEQCGEGIVRSAPSINVVVPTRYQYDFGVAPEIIEAVLRESLEETGQHVSQLLTPSYIDREAIFTNGLVKVVLRRLSTESNGDVKPNGHNGFPSEAENSETVFAKYLIGADGKCVIQASTGAVIIIPREEDKIRVYVQFSPNEATRDTHGRLALPIEVVSNMVLEKAKLGLKPYTVDFTHVHWCTIFTGEFNHPMCLPFVINRFSVSQMVAAKYSVDERIFIIGDACHTHSPKAGQGTNAAIGDAHNLAWKIAHVLRGWAKPSLLHTYEVERRRYAQDLITFDKIIAESLDGGTAADYQSLLHQQSMFTSGIGIHYKSSLIMDTDLPNGASRLEAGYRLPSVVLDRLADCDKEKAMWTDVPKILRDWKRVFIASPAESAYIKLGISAEGAAILVRPDGHVSLASILSTSAQEIIMFFDNL
ncbi:hypothetical protein B0H19DRAFT_1272913 [Mycena capillaripes]|nr:hypothetical protein B0H19DRAFT_1272913 [Mycena capillaripes]